MFEGKKCILFAIQNDMFSLWKQNIVIGKPVTCSTLTPGTMNFSNYIRGEINPLTPDLPQENISENFKCTGI